MASLVQPPNRKEYPEYREKKKDLSSGNLSMFKAIALESRWAVPKVAAANIKT